MFINTTIDSIYNVDIIQNRNIASINPMRKSGDSSGEAHSCQIRPGLVQAKRAQQKPSS